MKKDFHKRFISAFLLLCIVIGSAPLLGFAHTEIENTPTKNSIVKQESSDFLATVFIEQIAVEILSNDPVNNIFPFNDSKINQRNSGFISHFIAKTQLLASESSRVIIPSLDTTTLIYPFHSFL